MVEFGSLFKGTVQHGAAGHIAPTATNACANRMALPTHRVGLLPHLT